jgi:hypothetical protein
MEEVCIHVTLMIGIYTISIQTVVNLSTTGPDKVNDGFFRRVGCSLKTVGFLE